MIFTGLKDDGVAKLTNCCVAVIVSLLTFGAFCLAIYFDTFAKASKDLYFTKSGSLAMSHFLVNISDQLR